MWVYFWVIFAAACLVTCELQCSSAKRCGQCIGQSFECVWCPAEDHIGPRCQTKEYHTRHSRWCSVKVSDPDVEQPVVFNENNPFDSGKGGARVVQIAPQNITVTARPGKTVSFIVGYKPAEDYPLDVYYLMDYSYTMQKTLKLLQEQGKEIYKRLSSYTSNLRLGIGTFVEKRAFPYANPFQVSYAFRNLLALTKDTEEFERALQNNSTGANYDLPEAGLDALMQAMVCKEELDWRHGSRKIIVLCTDNTYHSAGDGKMAGAAKLNDMKCHLNASGYYNLELEQDYPTVNQINKVAKEQNTIVIFNAFKNVKGEYEALAKKINGAQYVELKEEGTFIVQTITKVYANSVRHLQMSVHKPSENILVSLDPDCTKTNRSDCAVTPEHKSLVLNVSVTVGACISNKEDGHVTLNPVGLGEKLAIQAKTLCACECEEHGVSNAKQCNSRGTFQCGICKCNENSFGDKCECTGDSAMLNSEKCRYRTDDSDVCSGRGTCRCGKCKCDDGFSGEFCEFDDNGCARADGLLCGGRGRCRAGACACRPGWTDDACQCPTDTAECQPPHSQNICSGNGVCKCGKCVCTKLDSKNNNYTGTFCDFCYECDELQCQKLEEYARCLFKPRGVCNKDLNTDNVMVVRVNRSEINDPKYHLAKLCKTHLEDERSIVFRHQYKGKRVELIIQNELEEPDRANMFIAIGSSIGIAVLLGLLAVIAWKVIVDIHDKREYDRFSEELDKSVDPSNINVLYKAPTVNFQNPNFRKSRVF